MKITVIGAGPGGLYFSLLTRKARPDWEVEVYEQNRSDDTFGFGVVFSDDTLDEFLNRDMESYDMVVDSFAYWDDIVIQRFGEEVRTSGNGFAGCSRLGLLQILQKRCEQVGVNIHYETVIDASNLDEQFPDSDIILASDGINSAIREHYSEQFKPDVNFKSNKFVWYGCARPQDAFTYFFKETEHGIVCAHTYQYKPRLCTWVIEMDTLCWEKHGFGELDEQQSAHLVEGIFADELQGYPFITNRSLWCNFPRIFCENWYHRNIVLLGDAKASAHFSIGSGTKLAMECAISLSDAVLEHAEHSVDKAFQAYDKERRVPVQITQHNADVSLAWFEHMRRSWDMKPMQFAMVVMARAKSITYDNLKLRDASFIEAVDTEFYQTYYDQTGFDCRETRPTPMFTPFKLRDMVLDNRVVVSPMAQYCCENGVPGDWHLVHLSSRAIGGAGLVYMEMTGPSPEARITEGCPGLWNDEQEQACKKIVDFCHANSRAKIALQLGHAGRKGSTQLGWDKMDYPIEPVEQNWPIVSASPIPFFDGISQVPAQLDRVGMDKIVTDFTAATVRANRAGFDLLELHCAHGYLLGSFLSPLTNLRSDEYGGDIDNRLRLPLEVFKAMRAVWPESKPMAIRISASDWKDGGITEQDTFDIAQAFSAAGCDLIDVSSGQTVADQKPIYGRMYQSHLSEAIRNEPHIATMTVGAITSAEQINTLIATRRADLVALARPHLVEPYFTRQAAAWYGTAMDDCPKQYLSGSDQLYRESAKSREQLLELQKKAKPNSHNPNRLPNN